MEYNEVKNKTFLITGGTGLVGSALVKTLCKSAQHIYCITRKEKISNQSNLTYLTADLKDKESLKKISSSIENVNYIIYLAASIPSLSEKKESMIEAKNNTLDPFLNFLEIFGEKSEKILFSSTIDIYGFPEKTDFDENTLIQPTTPYAIAKLACEKYLEFFCNQKKIQYSIVRFSQVYGPNEPFVRVIPFIIDAGLQNKPFNLYGSGKDKRRFLYVYDAVQGLIKALIYGENDVYHIAGNEDISILDVIKIAEGELKKQIIINQKEANLNPRHILPSTGKAEKELQFKPLFSFKNGINEILNNH